MPRNRLTSYLKTARLHSGLSQQEVGDLIGISRSMVAKIESGDRPSRRFVLEAEVLFGSSGRDLFPAVYQTFETELILRAFELELRLADKMTAVARHKRSFLNALINRLQLFQSSL